MGYHLWRTPWETLHLSYIEPFLLNTIIQLSLAQGQCVGIDLNYNTKVAFEVAQSFNQTSGYFISYLTRNITEFILALSFLVLMIHYAEWIQMVS